MNNQYCIYKIINNINNKIYIGQTIRSANNRWSNHKSQARNLIRRNNQLISKAIYKYGAENFQFIVIDFAFTQAQADCLESNYIIQFDSRNPDKGYNLRPGGNTQASWAKGKHFTEEHKRKLSESNKGHYSPLWSEERKEEVSQAYSGQGNPFFGKQHADETKNHLKQVRQNKLTRRARLLTNEQAEYIRGSTKSSRILAEEFNVSKPTILNIKNNKIYKVIK